MDEKKVNKDETMEMLVDFPIEPVIKDWIQHHTNDILSIWNQQGTLCYVSNAIQKVMGYTPPEILHKTWKSFISRKDVKRLYDIFQQHQINSTLELELTNKKGHQIWCKLILTKYRHPKTGDHYYVGILQNITTEKEVKRLIHYSEKMSVAGQLATGIAHEIRNPLTSLKGFLQLMQTGINGKEIYFNIMVEEIKKIEKITSELLYISKPIVYQEYTKESAVTMLIEVIELLKTEAKLKNISIQLLAKENHNFYIECNKSEIKQVFINIIKNAVEAIKNEGKIQVVLNNTRHHVTIDVMDNGIGIDPVQKDSLEKAFYTTKKGGTGLGLVICKEIINRHQGQLSFWSNDDEGTTFRITFPKAT